MRWFVTWLNPKQCHADRNALTCTYECATWDWSEEHERIMFQYHIFMVSMPTVHPKIQKMCPPVHLLALLHLLPGSSCRSTGLMAHSWVWVLISTTWLEWSWISVPPSWCSVRSVHSSLEEIQLQFSLGMRHPFSGHVVQSQLHVQSGVQGLRQVDKINLCWSSEGNAGVRAATGKYWNTGYPRWEFPRG